MIHGSMRFIGKRRAAAIAAIALILPAWAVQTAFASIVDIKVLSTQCSTSCNRNACSTNDYRISGAYASCGIYCNGISIPYASSEVEKVEVIWPKAGHSYSQSPTYLSTMFYTNSNSITGVGAATECTDADQTSSISKTWFNFASLNNFPKAHVTLNHSIWTRGRL